MRTASDSRFFRPDNFVLAGWLLFLAVFLVFFPVLFNGFTNYDDTEYVTQNPHIQSGLTLNSLAWAFQIHGANWHPLTWLSHSLDCQFFGLKPWGHHLGNVLLHALNTMLAFHALRKLTGNAPRSFVVALLFGLHPLRVESVAWVAERKDVLSAFFWMLTLLAYAAYVQQADSPVPNRKRLCYALVLVSFALGLMGKSMLVTLPCVLLLLDFWPLARCKKRSLLQLALEKIPFFLLSFGLSLLTFSTQYHGSALVSSLSLESRVGNALVSYCRYLGKTFWPENLCAIYPYPKAWPVAGVCGAAVMLAAITSFFLMRLRTRPYLATGWFWFLGALVPVIGLVQIGNQSMADRYTYIPSLGILIALVWGVAEITKNLRHRTVLLSMTTAALACACAVLTIRQIRYWKDSESLYQRAYAVTQDNVLADVFLGSSLAERGDWDGAISLYHKAIELAPGYYDPHYDLGLALIHLGRADDAIAEFQTAMKCRPNTADCLLNLGVALYMKGDTSGATAQFEKAASLDPSSAAAHSNLGKIYLSAKDFTAAAREFQSAVALAPNDPETHNNLGIALGIKGDLDHAIQEFQAALKSDPHHAGASTNLANALQMKTRNAASLHFPGGLLK
jgi:Flp pilus assembly protein TadD